MIKAYSLFTAALLFAITRAGAQTIVESATGTSSVILEQGGIVFVNFADEAVKLGHTYRVSSKPYGWGVDVKLKAPNGLANL